MTRWKVPHTSSKKGLVNLTNDDNECFRWCHIRYLNPQEKDPQRVTKSDKEILLQLDYEGIELPVSVKDYTKFEWKNTTNINVFGYEKKVHRVLEFDRSPWLKQYIDVNTQKRMNAKNSFEKDFFKLMNNSVFGKTIENIRKGVDVRLVTDQNKWSKLVSKATFVNSKILNEDLVGVRRIKETLRLNRPAYVGMCILDLSKTLMYDFHHNYIKEKYGSRAKLLFTDTDSLCHEIETWDAYKDFWADKDKFEIAITPKIVHTLMQLMK